MEETEKTDKNPLEEIQRLIHDTDLINNSEDRVTRKILLGDIIEMYGCVVQGTPSSDDIAEAEKKYSRFMDLSQERYFGSGEIDRIQPILDQIDKAIFGSENI